MRTLRQHIPAFVDTGDDRPTSVAFETLDELFAIPWVAHWTEPVPDSFECKVLYPGAKEFVLETRKQTPHTFHRWSIDENRLMCETNGGRNWWVVGFIDDTRGLDLPKWVPIYSKNTSKGANHDQ